MVDYFVIDFSPALVSCFNLITFSSPHQSLDETRNTRNRHDSACAPSRRYVLEGGKGEYTVRGGGAGCCSVQLYASEPKTDRSPGKVTNGIKWPCDERSLLVRGGPPQTEAAARASPLSAFAPDQLAQSIKVSAACSPPNSSLNKSSCSSISRVKLSFAGCKG